MEEEALVLGTEAAGRLSVEHLNGRLNSRNNRPHRTLAAHTAVVGTVSSSRDRFRTACRRRRHPIPLAVSRHTVVSNNNMGTVNNLHTASSNSNSSTHMVSNSSRSHSKARTVISAHSKRAFPAVGAGTAAEPRYIPSPLAMVADISSNNSRRSNFLYMARTKGIMLTQSVGNRRRCHPARLQSLTR